MKKPTTERAGRAHAVRFLREMEVYNYMPDPDDVVTTLWPWSIEAQFRPEGMQQDIVMLRYLDALQGNRAALAGFCSAITDYIGAHEQGGGTPWPSYYNKLTSREITGKPGPWPTMDDEDNERKAAFDSFMARLLPGGKDNHA